MNNLSMKKAFTLAEIMIALFISAIIAMIFLKAIRTGTNHYTNTLMAYSAFTTLETAVYDMSQKGCGAADAALTPVTTPTHPYCFAATGYLPWYRHTSDNRGFCDRLVREEFNTVGATHCDVAPTAILDSTTNFSGITPAFTTTNGMRFYFVSSFDANGAGTVGASYHIMVDIDGPRRNSILGVDVVDFRVNTDGTMFPRGNDVSGNSTEYLTASVRYVADNGNFVYPLTGVNYREAICLANTSTVTSPPAFPRGYNSGYCGAVSSTSPTPFNNPAYDAALQATLAPDCATEICEAIIDEPGILGVRNIFSVDNRNN